MLPTLPRGGTQALQPPHRPGAPDPPSAPAARRRRITRAQPFLAALCSMVERERGSNSVSGRLMLTCSADKVGRRGEREMMLFSIIFQSPLLLMATPFLKTPYKGTPSYCTAASACYLSTCSCCEEGARAKQPQALSHRRVDLAVQQQLHGALLAAHAERKVQQRVALRQGWEGREGG